MPSPNSLSTHVLTLTALLLTSSLTTAFIPIQPLPSDLDTNIWIPIATITLSTTPTPSNALVERQGAAVTAGAAAQSVDQISPVTTYQANEYIAGVAVAVNIVYTQTFPAVPDQWASASAGSIGLGTIQGQVGVVKTKVKRNLALPTQQPILGGDGGGVRIQTAEAEATAAPEEEVRVEVEAVKGDMREVTEPALVKVNAAGRRAAVVAVTNPAAAVAAAASLLMGVLLL